MSTVNPVAASNSDQAYGYLPNLTAIIDDQSGRYSDQDKAIATRQRNQREYEAFGRLQAGAAVLGDNRAYYRAYLNYLSQLSPAELATSRYAGLAAQVSQALAVEDQKAQEKAKQPDPNLQTLLAGTKVAPLPPPSKTGSLLPGKDSVSSLASLNRLYALEQSGARTLTTTQLAFVQNGGSTNLLA